MENKFSQVWGNREWQWVETDTHGGNEMHDNGNGADMGSDVTKCRTNYNSKLIIRECRSSVKEQRE